MANNYQFYDAYGSVLTAASQEVAGAHQPIVQINSALGAIPVSLSSISPSSVSGVGVFNVNNVGNGSIIGTYVEDSAHATGDRGIFTLGVRNDNLSSVTSANGDYTPFVTGPVGELIVSPAPLTKWLQAETSIMYGTSVQAIAPQGSSVFTYVKSAQVVNASANNVIVKFTGGLGSVLGWTSAPANGGSNIVFSPAIKTGANSGFSASISGVASVYLSAQGFTSNT